MRPNRWMCASMQLRRAFAKVVAASSSYSTRLGGPTASESSKGEMWAESVWSYSCSMVSMSQEPSRVSACTFLTQIPSAWPSLNLSSYLHNIGSLDDAASGSPAQRLLKLALKKGECKPNTKLCTWYVCLTLVESRISTSPSSKLGKGLDLGGSCIVDRLAKTSAIREDSFSSIRQPEQRSTDRSETPRSMDKSFLEWKWDNELSLAFWLCPVAFYIELLCLWVVLR